VSSADLPIETAMSQPDIQLSPAERRLLRKTFRRHAAPYLVVGCAVAFWALSWGRVETEVDPKGPDADAEIVIVSNPAFQRLASQVEESQAALRALAKAPSAAAGPDPALAELTQRLAALEQRASQAERRVRELEQRPAAVQGQAPPSSSEISGVLDRLQRIERRQDQQERAATAVDSDATATQRSMLERLHNLESRIGSVEGAASPAM
jgi:phage shock protein A